MTKKIALIFILALAANVIWENLHSPLYLHHQGGAITQYILFRAALFDAVFITAAGFIFLNTEFLRKRLWISFVIGIAAAVLIEWYALAAGRWAYAGNMPIIPLLNTGLTPTIQLGILSYLILRVVTRMQESGS